MPLVPRTCYGISVSQGDNDMSNLSMDALEKALASYDEVLGANTGGNEKLAKIIRDSQIKRFEYTYELSWKLIQKVLQQNFGITDITQKPKKDLFREAKQKALVDNLDAWFRYHSVRNQTSHIYDEEQVQRLLNDIADFNKQVDYTLTKLKEITQ